ncbi:hypothetical protein [Williamsia sp. M5A3_1d]
MSADFARIEADSDGLLGVAIATDAGVRRFGADVPITAWSTIKVPLALAATSASGDARTAGLVEAAITESDNSAAESLWSELGAPTSAGRDVENVLAAGGDTTTRVQTERIRIGFTAFGQTMWPIAEQASWAAHMRCIRGARFVYELMRKITTSQRWGLAARGMAAKGGWGPDADGRYLVRQMAVIPARGANIGVAIAARPDDGTFASGVRLIDTLSNWVLKWSPRLAGTACRR